MDIELTSDDPTIFTKCPYCCRRGRGVIQGDYFAKAFSRKKWGKGGKLCPNCETKLEVIYEVR